MVGTTAEHTQGDIAAVSQSTTQGQFYLVHRVQSALCYVLRAGVLQELLVAGLTPPPRSHPIVTEDELDSGDMNTNEDEGGGGPIFLPGP